MLKSIFIAGLIKTNLEELLKVSNDDLTKEYKNDILEKIEKLKKEIENIVAVKRIYIADLSKAEEHINRFKVEFERTKGNYRDLIRIRETIETLENIRENLNQQSSENLKEKRVIE